MFDRDRWQEIINAILQNKMRSFLTAFGVGWGIFMLVVMTGAGNGLVNGISSGMKNFATNSAFVWSQRTTKPYKGFKQGRYWEFTNQDMASILHSVPEVDVLAPKLQGWNVSHGDNVIRGNRAGSFTVNGDVPEYNLIDPSEMIYGRFLNKIDMDENRKVCIIGERVYEVMFEKDEDPVGEYIKVSGVWFQVVGVFRSLNPYINMGSDKKESIYVPFTTMQQVYNYGDKVHFIGFTAKKGYSVEQTTEKVMALLREKHSIAPDDSDAMGYIDVENMIKTMSYAFLGIHLLIWIVGIGTLIAGAVGISNIMLVVVRERTKEIGIQRAIGAAPNVIVGQILTESVFLTTLAGFVGLSLGTLVLHLVDKGMKYAAQSNPSGEAAFFTDPSIGFFLAATTFVVLIITGLIAGFIPAQKAIRVKPIDALRQE